LKQTNNGFPERIETERLILRRWRSEHWSDFRAVRTNPAVWRSLGGDQPVDEAHVRRRFDYHLGHWRERGYGLMAVIERSGGSPVGWTGPAHPDFVHDLVDEVEIGWTLLPAFWGRGLGTEGAGAAMNAAFEHLEPERVISLIEPGNSRSLAVAERLGMRRAGNARHDETGEELLVYELRRPRA
jgi:RimJ/RimL family protein N-acetyltransferase